MRHLVIASSKWVASVGMVLLIITCYVSSQPTSTSTPLTPPSLAPSTDVSTSSPVVAASDSEEGLKCTPFDKPAPLTNFDASKLDGVWYEIATSILPRSTEEEGCTCSAMKWNHVVDPQAKQALGGRELFDLYASCNKLTTKGKTIRKVGQAIQINPTSDRSSFEMFMVEAKLQDDGEWAPAVPPQQLSQPSPTQPQQALQPVGTRPATVQRIPARVAAPLSAPLAQMLNPNLTVLKVLGDGEKYMHAIFASPCKEGVWVTSRENTMPEEQYSELLAAAKAVGIDTTAIGLSKTLQTGCPTPSFS